MLPKGVSIASQDNLDPMCCVGVMVAAVSVHETPSTAGESHMLGRLDIHEATGGKLGAEAGRERMFYRYVALRDSLPLAVEVIRSNPASLRNQLRTKVAEAQDEMSFLQILNCFYGIAARCWLFRRPW